MEGSPEFRDLLAKTAQRVLQSLDRPAAGGEGPVPSTAWELKLQLKVPNALLYLALGWLAREGQIEMTPQDWTYRIRRHAPAPAASQQS
jgi:hypothetical protein